MIGAAYCILGFLIAFAFARRSFGRGLFVVFLWGYVYGYLRANYLDGLTHFGTDAAIVGMYFGRLAVGTPREGDDRHQTALAWATALIAWPVAVMIYSQAFESQPLVIQLVGLRPMLVFAPMLVVGARLTREDLDYLAPRVAALNVAVFAVACVEFVFGVDRVIPRNLATQIVYSSTDVVAGDMLYQRIPSTFIHAHAYGFTMLASIPFVAHGFESARRERLLCFAGIGAAILGILMCGARTPVVFVGLATAYVLASLRVKTSTWLTFLAAGAIAFAAAMTNERLQRFETLADTDMVQTRLASSVNSGFLEVCAEFPFGAGLARGWGTSIPYFLQDEALPQVGIENEFGRIVIDTGIPGLVLWLGFFVWASMQKDESASAPIMKSFARPLTILILLGSSLGVGLFMAIPLSPMLMLLIGTRSARGPRVAARSGLRLIGHAPAVRATAPALSASTPPRLPS